VLQHLRHTWWTQRAPSWRLRRSWQPGRLLGAPDSTEFGPTAQGFNGPKSTFQSMMGNQTHCLGSTNAPPASTAWAHLQTSGFGWSGSTLMGSWPNGITPLNTMWAPSHGSSFQTSSTCGGPCHGPPGHPCAKKFRSGLAVVKDTKSLLA
jgi:hypothetical protein